LQLPTEEKFLMTQPEIEDQIAVMLGGRAAEDVIYDGVVSTGAANDLERASDLARQIVIRYGMSERLGLMTYVKSQGPRHFGSGAEERNYSECTAEAIDQESRRIIDTIYARVRGILRDHRDQLRKVACELISRETLMGDELLGLLERRPTGTASLPSSSASVGA
jgi:cell division protease FtsH